jgi:hypothetical protein
MPTADRARWFASVRTHAALFNKELRNLVDQIGPVFGGPTLASASTQQQLDPWTATRQLTDLSTQIDADVRQSFLLRAQSATLPAVKSAEFWRAVQKAHEVSLSLVNTTEK